MTGTRPLGHAFGLSLPMQHPIGDDLGQRFAELLEMVRLARQAGFHHISASQHYLAAPFQYMQPLPVLARVAAEAGEMTLGTGIMLLALQQPVDVAESVATLDVICGGRFVFGVGLGYRDVEFDAFGIARGGRLSRFLEALDVVQRLWTEEAVTFHGKHFQLTGRPSHRCAPSRSLARPSSWPPAMTRWWSAWRGSATRWTIAGHATLATLERQVALYRARSPPASRCPPPLSVSARSSTSRGIWTRPCGRPCRTSPPRIAPMNSGASSIVLPGERVTTCLEELRRNRFIVGDRVLHRAHRPASRAPRHQEMGSACTGPSCRTPVLRAIALLGERCYHFA